MSSDLARDAAYYRDRAENCRQMRDALEAGPYSPQRDEQLRDLERDAALWTQLADEIDSHTGPVEADLFSEVS